MAEDVTVSVAKLSYRNAGRAVPDVQGTAAGFQHHGCLV